MRIKRGSRISLSKREKEMKLTTQAVGKQGGQERIMAKKRQS
jgi:hypothetical protein